MSGTLRQFLVAAFPIALIFGLFALGWAYVQGNFRLDGDRYDNWRDQYLNHDPAWWCRWRPQSDIPARQYFARLPERSPEAISDQYPRWKSLLAEVERYRPTENEDRLHHAHILAQLQQDVAGEPYQSHVFPLAPIGGEHLDLLDLMVRYQPVATQAEAKYYLRRLNVIPELCQDWQLRLDTQAEQGLLPSRMVMEAARDQLRTWVSLPPLSHPLYLAFARRAARASMTEFNDDVALGYLTQIDQTLAEEVYPAWQQLIDQLEALMPQADTLPGIGKLPQGAEWYAHLLRGYSAVSSDPDDLLSLSDQAIAEWQQAISLYRDSLKLPAGDDLTPADPIASPPLKDLLSDLSGEMRDLRQYVRGLTDTVPRKRIQFWPSLEHGFGPALSYLPGSLDGLHKPRLRLEADALVDPDRAKSDLAVHTYLYPGLHLLMTRQLQHESRPDLRRSLPHPAIREGWHMYSGYLMDHDLAAYWHRPALRLHYLSLQLQRAVAMRVDLGVHHQNWSFSQAQAFVRSHWPASDAAQRRLLLGVMSQPGKAVAALTGFEALRKWRQQLQAQMGDRFYLQAFHDQVLYQGCLWPSVFASGLAQWAKDDQDS